MGWVLLPLVALLGGMWAFSPTVVKQEVPTLASALGLVIGGWCTLWRSIMGTNWVTPLEQWKTWNHTAPLARWPYLQNDTPGEALHTTLGQAISWWHTVGRPMLAKPLRKITTAILLSLLLSLSLGRTALLLSALFIAWTELAILWHGGQERIKTGWIATALVGLPWLLGASLQSPPAATQLMSTGVLILLSGFFASHSPLAALGPLTTISFLVWQTHVITAAWILLLSIPGLLLLQQKMPAETYQRTIAPWLVAMVLLIARVL